MERKQKVFVSVLVPIHMPQISSLRPVFSSYPSFSSFRHFCTNMPTMLLSLIPRTGFVFCDVLLMLRNNNVQFIQYERSIISSNDNMRRRYRINKREKINREKTNRKEAMVFLFMVQHYQLPPPQMKIMKNTTRNLIVWMVFLLMMMSNHYAVVLDA